jgi:hypothetical protein
VLRARLVVGRDGRRDGARVLGGVGLHGIGGPQGERERAEDEPIQGDEMEVS